MDVNVGAVGAAVIAGLVSVLGLIISKEQKVSEFRQAWIDELRKCLIAYLVNINAISDNIRQKKGGSADMSVELGLHYKQLNEASHGIMLRVNGNEKPAKRLIETMQRFEQLAQNNKDLTPENIQPIETDFLKHSKRLLKFEWNRVKKGEGVFTLTKRVIGILTLIMICYFFYLTFTSSHKDRSRATATSIYFV